VVAVRLICSGTIEEKIMNMQASITDLFNDLINTDTDIGKSFTKDGLLALLREPHPTLSTEKGVNTFR
jgi:SNF2 family DNA or RNA helicase